jgi:SAM-dependent methyltransferase
MVFADEHNPWSMIGGFGEVPDDMGGLSQLPRAFQTGVGFTYDAGGESVVRGTERFLAPWHRTLLVRDALPRLDGVVAKLEAGAEVADIGCGGGVALVAMAQAFPNSRFHGYDTSEFALARARANIAEAGVSNVSVHNPDADPLPGEPLFDLVTTFDALHDMTRPDLAAAAVRRAIKPDGTWFVVDVNCAPTFEENAANPAAPLMYAFSIMTCLSSSSSTPDGLALGTLGLPEPRMGELVRAAGFTRFQRVPGLEHPFNAYYEVRP